MREHWRVNGPPLNVAAVAIAAALGVDLVGARAPQAIPDVSEGVSGPSIAELAELAPAALVHDTRAASRAIAERWKGSSDGRR